MAWHCIARFVATLLLFVFFIIRGTTIELQILKLLLLSQVIRLSLQHSSAFQHVSFVEFELAWIDFGSKQSLSRYSWTRLLKPVLRHSILLILVVILCDAFVFLQHTSALQNISFVYLKLLLDRFCFETKSFPGFSSKRLLGLSCDTVYCVFGGDPKWCVCVPTACQCFAEYFICDLQACMVRFCFETKSSRASCVSLLELVLWHSALRTDIVPCLYNSKVIWKLATCSVHRKMVRPPPIII